MFDESQFITPGLVISTIIVLVFLALMYWLHKRNRANISSSGNCSLQSLVNKGVVKVDDHNIHRIKSSLLAQKNVDNWNKVQLDILEKNFGISSQLENWARYVSGDWKKKNTDLLMSPRLDIADESLTIGEKQIYLDSLESIEKLENLEKAPDFKDLENFLSFDLSAIKFLIRDKSNSDPENICSDFFKALLKIFNTALYTPSDVISFSVVNIRTKSGEIFSFEFLPELAEQVVADIHQRRLHYMKRP